MHQNGSDAPRPASQAGSDLAAGTFDRATGHLAPLAAGDLSPVLEAHVKGFFSQAQGRRGNHCLDQADGQGQSALGSGAYSGRIVETGHPGV
ncbi:MAG: hypothetical protein ACXVAV_12400 [Ktedonobacteraceae bacterium]